MFEYSFGRFVHLPQPFVVFLGQGHWPMLKYFIPTLEAAVPFNESPLIAAKS